MTKVRMHSLGSDGVQCFQKQTNLISKRTESHTGRERKEKRPLKGGRLGHSPSTSHSLERSGCPYAHPPSSHCPFSACHPALCLLSQLSFQMASEPHCPPVLILMNLITVAQSRTFFETGVNCYAFSDSLKYP